MPTQEQREKFMEIRDAAKLAGIKQPEIIAAQWALESAWGARQTGRYNYWGVKAGNGDPNNKEEGSIHWTREVVNGKSVRMQQKFKDYDSLVDAMKDRQEFTSRKNGRYDKAGYADAVTPSQAAEALQRGGYATDPKYADKLKSILRGVGIDPDKDPNHQTPSQSRSELNNSTIDKTIISYSENNLGAQVNDLLEKLQSGAPNALAQFVTANSQQLTNLKEQSIQQAETLNKLEQTMIVQAEPAQNIEPETRSTGRSL